MAIENENIISNFIQALQIEVNEQRSKSVEESLDLENGERQSKTTDRVIYAFFINEDLRATKFRDDVPVTLIVGDSETEATIVSAADKKIIISTDDDLGKHLPLAKIKEGIPVVLFIGAIHLNPLISANLAALRIGELINQKGATIKCNLLLT